MATCAFGIVHNKDRILLVKIAPPFAEAEKWNFPGGVVEEGEDSVTGLIREIYEETGVVCSIGDKIDRFTTTNPDNDITIFNATYVKGEISIQEEEILEARWCTIPEALNLDLAFNIREYIRQL